MIMNDLNKQELSAITEKIIQTLLVRQIWLFGSFAYGSPRKDSDYDIYVVIPDNTLRQIEAMQQISYAIWSVQKRQVDVLVQSQSRFDELKTLPTIENEVYSKGVLLYECRDAV